MTRLVAIILTLIVLWGIHDGRAQFAGGGGAAKINLANYTQTFSDTFTGSLSISATGQGTTWAYNKPDNEDFGQIGYDNFTNASGAGPLTIPLINSGGWQGGIIASVQTLSGASPGTGFAQQYGYFEMSAQLPGNTACTAGSTWPAFWLLAQNHITSNLVIPDVEIDILEQFGNYECQVGQYTYHHWTSVPFVQFLAGSLIPQQSNTANIFSGYHTYGLSIDASNIIWYFDRVPLASMPTPAEAKTPMYILVDLACSGSPPCGDVNTVSPSNMLVQYVKAYSHN